LHQSSCSKKRPLNWVIASLNENWVGISLAHDRALGPHSCGERERERDGERLRDGRDLTGERDLSRSRSRDLLRDFDFDLDLDRGERERDFDLDDDDDSKVLGNGITDMIKHSHRITSS